MGSYQAHSGRFKFSKLLIITWKAQRFSLANFFNASSFPLSDRLTFFFKIMPAMYPSLNNHSSFQLFFQVRMCSMQKSTSSAHNSNNCTSAFPRNNNITLAYRSVLGILPILSYRMLKRCALKGQDLIKLILHWEHS